MNYHNRLKLRPVLAEQSKYLTPKIRIRQTKNSAAIMQLPRFKTQADEQSSSIFNYQMSVGRRHSTSQKNPRKEYELLRQMQLRKEAQPSINKRRKDLQLFRPSKQPSDVVQKLEEKANIIQFNPKELISKVKDLENNIIRLSSIFNIILKRGDGGQIINKIKEYVLQQQSDLGEFETGAIDSSVVQCIKQIIYMQRVLLLIIIQSLLVRCFKTNQVHFQHILKDLMHFYSILYQLVSQKPLSALLDQQKMIHQLSTSLSPFSLFAIRDRIIKRIQISRKSFVQIQRFVSVELSKFKGMSTNLLYYNLLNFYAGRLSGGDWSGWGIEFLQTCPSPYVHYPSTRRYTLLLDLDQTLAHYRTLNSTKGEFLLRPYLFDFLNSIQPYFQLGIFTCALKEYADIILQHLPTISIRLYRQHAVRIGKELIKDLSRVGRDLNRVILVDNLEKNFKLQKENGIHVRSWFGDPKDTVLKQLQAELIQIAKNEPQDLRLSNHKRAFL